MVTGRFGFFIAGNRTCRDWELSTKGCCEMNRGGQILLRRAKAKCRLAECRAAQYLGNGRASSLHGRRRTGSVSEDVD